MIRSMTGFGSARVAKGPFVAQVDVRSVNHRHLQVKSRLPGELSHLEPAIEATVRDALERGSVSVSATVEHADPAGEVRVDVEAARRYRKSLAALAKDLDLEGGVKLETLIGLPGVIGARDEGRGRRNEDDLVLACTRKALAALVTMRAAEGKSLLADLRKHTKGIAGLVGGIEKRMPGVVRGHHENLKKRVEDLLEGRDGRIVVRPEDLARELALLADRMDVGEEVARLRSHLGQWESLLGKSGAVGRQLEFLVQEILREANTVGSKCNDAKVAHAVVELKALIERLREQVQNVE